MTQYDVGAVRTGLNTLLGTIASVENVYDFPQANIAGYPAVIFDLDNETGTMLDDASNQRVLTFKVWIACETPVDGIQGATTLLDSVTKDVINALEKLGNQTLSGACDWMMPVIGNRQQVNSPEGNYLYQELNLKVYIASSIL